ncbi:hypothetical protein LP421_32015 (plasmid) [Rhizobium sp. RCAM05350]|nr:hypothetical protein LP421_32015 [Rhizobium sp. RCAM05350]
MSRPDTTYPRPLAATAESRKGWTFLADPLARNGLALVSSAALSSILGLAYWVLAARLYPAEVVGINAVMINSMIVLANLGQLNLGNFLTRTLAGTGPQAGRIVMISYILATASGAVFRDCIRSPFPMAGAGAVVRAFFFVDGCGICILCRRVDNLQPTGQRTVGPAAIGMGAG